MSKATNGPPTTADLAGDRVRQASRRTIADVATPNTTPATLLARDQERPIIYRTAQRNLDRTPRLTCVAADGDVVDRLVAREKSDGDYASACSHCHETMGRLVGGIRDCASA
jgi:hypothetical protein